MAKKDTFGVLTLTKKNAENAYRKGCPEFKAGLRLLFPDYEFEEKTQIKKGIWFRPEDGEYMLITREGTGWFFQSLVIYPELSRYEIDEITIRAENWRFCPNSKIQVIRMVEGE